MTKRSTIRMFAYAMLYSLALICGGALSATRAPITMDQAYLNYARSLVAAQDPELMPAYERLLREAKLLLAIAPEAVTHKKLLPPSGDRHDYMSLAPYWWPDPARPDGLPYVRRDGHFNPSAKNDDSDSVRIQVMCLGTQSLSLAYFFTGDEVYARKAADFIRSWFLAPATRMNPNLRYGQAVMGVVDGRGIGLIDTRNLWMVIDAVALIAPAGQLDERELAGLRAWFGDFVRWMLTSDIGIEEFNAYNNHGSFYDMQVAAYSLFAGDEATAKRAVERATDLRIASQIAADGRQHAELERTTPFHYSAFNLDAMENIARYGEQLGVKVWQTRAEGRGIQRGLDYLASFAARPETWPYKELRRAETELALSVLLRAERAYRDGRYAKVVAELPLTRFETQEYLGLNALLGTEPPDTQNVIDRLIWPQMPPKTRAGLR